MLITIDENAELTIPVKFAGGKFYFKGTLFLRNSILSSEDMNMATVTANNLDINLDQIIDDSILDNESGEINLQGQVSFKKVKGRALLTYNKSTEYISIGVVDLPFPIGFTSHYCGKCLDEDCSDKT